MWYVSRVLAARRRCGGGTSGDGARRTPWPSFQKRSGRAWLLRARPGVGLRLPPPVREVLLLLLLLQLLLLLRLWTCPPLWRRRPGRGATAGTTAITCTGTGAAAGTGLAAVVVGLGAAEAAAGMGAGAARRRRPGAPERTRW